MKKQILTLSAAAFMAALTCQTAFALDHDVVILHTNDTHCGIEENMGYAGLVWYENQMKEETPYVTLVDAGDAIQGAPVGTLSEGEYLVQIMNKAGYDFAVPGNHEFDYGMEKLLGLSARLDCGYSACNFVKDPGVCALQDHGVRRYPGSLCRRCHTGEHHQIHAGLLPGPVWKIPLRLL